MDKVVVNQSFCGIFAMQVCAEKDATDEEILRTCNTKNRSGTGSGWLTVDRTAPVQCKDHPDRLHIMVTC